MALPRKGTRTLTLDDHRLRWLVRRRKGGFRLVVESADAPGQKLIVDIAEAAFQGAPAVVSPQIVRQAVVLGRAQGFDPTLDRGQVELSIAAGMLALSKVDRDALLPRPVGRPRKRAPGEKRRPVYVSLDKEDRARLEAAAAEAGLPIGTLARQWLLERLATQG